MAGSLNDAVANGEKLLVRVRELDDRWQVLKGWLEGSIKADLAVADSFRGGGPRERATAAAHCALVSAHRSTLARMRELEAGS